MGNVVSAERMASIVCLAADWESPLSAEDRAAVSAWRRRYSQAGWARESRHAVNNCNCSSSACEGQYDEGGISLWIELVDSCNLDCVFCYNPWRPPDSPFGAHRVLRVEELLAAVERVLERVPVGHVTLSGGEPLLHPDIEEVARRVRLRCPNIGLTTNGRSVSRRRIDRLAAAGVNHVSVPVHSHVAAVHDELAGGKSWRAAVRAVALSVETGVETTLTCVLTSRNAGDVRGVAHMASWLGVGSVVANCFHATGQGTGKSGLALSDDEFRRAVSELTGALGDRAEVFVGSPPPAGAGERPSANGRVNGEAQVSRIAISPFGDVKLCNQSHSGVVNILDDPAGFEEFLGAASRGDYQKYIPRVDSCTCH